MRLIDADLLKEDLSKFYDGIITARELIDRQPTVELLKEQQQGKQKPVKPIYGSTVNGTLKIMCGKCRRKLTMSWVYCPECATEIGWSWVNGAKDGEQE